MKLAKEYDGNDRFYLEAVGIAVGHFDKARRDVILADFDKAFPQWNDKVADLVWELQPPDVLLTLGKRLADKSLTPAQRGRIVDILAVADSQAGGAVLLKVLETDVPQEVRDKVINNLKLFLPGKWQGFGQQVSDRFHCQTAQSAADAHHRTKPDRRGRENGRPCQSGEDRLELERNGFGAHRRGADVRRSAVK